MNKISETTEEKAKIISIWSRLAKVANEEVPVAKEPSDSPTESFLETMRKNAQVQKRLEQDRLKANQQVLRSYKIKT